jgi:hypothetical protein
MSGLKKWLCSKLRCGIEPTFRFRRTYPIAWSELARCLREAYYNAQLKVADVNYHYVEWEELLIWLNTDSLDKMRWIDDIWDCDNFSLESFCRMKRLGALLGINITYGEAWGDTPLGYHAFKHSIREKGRNAKNCYNRAKK